MRISKNTKTVLSLSLSALMAYVPNFAAAHGNVNGGMITTSSVLADIDRSQAEQQIEGYLQRADVQQALSDQGLSSDEIRSRLASLSPQEINQLSQQMEQARAGGDILVTILIVVLIIFLIKRI